MKQKVKRLLVSSTDKTLFQFIRYGMVGGVSFAVDFGLLYLLTSLCGLHYLLSACFSFLAGLGVNYMLSTRWVFNASNVRNRTLEFFLFLLIGVAGLGFTELLMWLFTQEVGCHYLLSKIITTVMVYFWNFFARKWFLYRTPAGR